MSDSSGDKAKRAFERAREAGQATDAADASESHRKRAVMPTPSTVADLGAELQRKLAGDPQLAADIAAASLPFDSVGEIIARQAGEVAARHRNLIPAASMFGGAAGALFLRNVTPYAIAASKLARMSNSLALPISEPVRAKLDLGSYFDSMVVQERARLRGLEVRSLAATMVSVSTLRVLLESIPKPPLSGALLTLADGLAAEYARFAKPSDTRTSVPSWLLTAPPSALYTTTRLAGVFASVSDEVLAEEAEDDEEDELRTGRDELEMRLAAVGAGFVEPYRGARDAQVSRRPDWVRHVSASLRELLDKLIDELAPPSAMVSFHPSPGSEEFRDGAWTRKAQLRYIFRNARSGGSVRMCDNIIDGVLMIFYPQNAGVHTLIPPHPPEGMEILIQHTLNQISILLTAAGY